MGWLRSNWLDALIFLLVAAIMAGVVFFLTGVNPLTALQGRSPQTSAPSAPTKPAQPAPQPGQKPQTQTAPAPQTPKPQPQAAPSSDSDTVVTVVPAAPSNPQPEAKPVPAPPKPADSTSAQPPSPAQSPAPSLAADRGGAWRIAVGSFADSANASRLAYALRTRGYPASLETSGSLTRVWVGPYATQSKAQSIAGGLGQYSPKVLSAGQGQSASPGSASTPNRPASPSSTARFLQVGAYKTREGAAPMAEKVKDAGYIPVLVEENGLVKVRVGPLDDPAAAKAALQAKGLDVLEVR